MIRPPPPMLTRTSVSSPASSANSSPTVPCPAITTGSSNGWTRVSPSSRNRFTRANALGMSSVSRSDAPAASTSATDRAGCRTRHDHGRLHIERRRHDRERDPVIAAAHRHHPGRQLGLAERQQFRRRTARLEGTRALQQLQLRRDRDAEQLGEPEAPQGRGAYDVSGDPLGGGFDLRDADQGSHPSGTGTGDPCRFDPDS